MLVILLVTVVGYGSSIDVCQRTERREVKWYFDDRWRMCFATRTDCVLLGGIQMVGRTMYDSEEECTLNNMKSRWMTYTLRCPADRRMAVYSRSNGDTVPYVFDARQCRRSSATGQPESDMCDSDETCMTSSYFGWCCKRIPYTGDGPSAGTFRFTGYGGPILHLINAAVTQSPAPKPFNCNEDGPRDMIEWYRAPIFGVGCYARRATCAHPAFARTNPEIVFPTQQDCIDYHYPNYSFTYHFNCGQGDSVVREDQSGVPLVFSPELCDGPNDSDFCNLDEYCAASSTVASCCKIGGGAPSRACFIVYGSQYRRTPSFFRPIRRISRN